MTGTRNVYKGKSRGRRGAAPAGPRLKGFISLCAKFPGHCRRCGCAFPVGTTIRYGGRRLTYHLAADCPASQREAEEAASHVEHAPDVLVLDSSPAAWLS